MNATSHSFNKQEIAQFEREGFVVSRGFTSTADCEAMRSIALRDLAAETLPVEYETETRYPGAPVSHDAPGGHTVRRLLQAYARDAVFANWAVNAAIACRLEQLPGSGVQLSQSHHNCIMTKAPAYSSITRWHRDIRYWSFERPELVSVWLALGREYFENGCLLLAPGSHRMDFRYDQVDAAQFLRDDVEENRELLRRQVVAELRPGDVLFFHCRLFHAAGHNRTADPKLSLVFTYHATNNQPHDGTRSASLPDIEVQCGVTVERSYLEPIVDHAMARPSRLSCTRPQESSL